jgi:hypothetical protein
MIGAAAGVFPQRLQKIRRRFPGVMAVFGGNMIESPAAASFSTSSSSKSGALGFAT